MEKEWRLIEDGLRDGPTNMAIDEAILEAVMEGRAKPTLRLYGWSPPAISLGYAQDIRRGINLSICQELGITVVRRPTGGRAVYHDKELTYSLVAPEDLFPGKAYSILEVYKEISLALIRGLALLGIEAHLVPASREKASRSAFCFSSPSSYEVAVKGKKIIGSAQRRCRGFILQQGSIILEIEREKLAAIFSDDADPSLNMTSIKEVSPDTDLDLIRIQKAIREGFLLSWDIRFSHEGLTEEEEERVQQLKQEKYSLPQWNLARPLARSDLGPV